MQASALTISPLNAFPGAPRTSCSPKLPATSTTSRFASIRTNALAVNYNSKTSVFPAEACETIGGDACIADAYPEVKPKPETRKPRICSEQVERDYIDYTDPRTVLLGDACEVLGGEFCESPYQAGVFSKFLVGNSVRAHTRLVFSQILQLKHIDKGIIKLGVYL